MGVLHTTENHAKEEFRTRWYRTNVKGAKDAILEIAKQKGYVVQGEVEVYNEIYLVSKKFDLVLTITSVNPRQTAVDLSIESHSFIDFGACKKEVREWYQLIDKKLDFIGIGLS